MLCEMRSACLVELADRTSSPSRTAYALGLTMRARYGIVGINNDEGTGTRCTPSHTPMRALIASMR